MRKLLIIIPCCLAIAVASAAAATTNLVAASDTTLQEAFPDNNLGGGPLVFSGGRKNGGRARTLLKFDVAAALPSGSVVNSASFSIQANTTAGTSSTYSLKPMSVSWNEGDNPHASGGSIADPGETTWNNRFAPSTPWTTAGGDYAPGDSATLAIGAVGNYTFTSTGLAVDVQAWIDTPAANNGWILISQSESTADTIHSFLDRTDPTTPPTLAINYTPPAPPASPSIFNLLNLGNNLRFSFNGQSGRSYTVRSQTTLGGTWNTVTNIPTLPANTVVHITNTIAGPAKFFQVRTP
jgi:hypothetical protein